MALSVNGSFFNLFSAYGGSKQYPMSQLNGLFADKDLIMRNRMKMFDSNGDFINSQGVAGMDIHGKDPSEWHQIIDIPEKSRQEMFDNVKREFLEENGIANGDTTKRTEVAVNYQKSVPKQDRLKGSWTLEQYERAYTAAFHEAVKAQNPNWQPGQEVDAHVLEHITRESVESRLVNHGNGSFSLGKFDRTV